MRIPWAYLGIVFATAMPADICGNECNFFERCNGDAIETCGGVDQCIGRHPSLETCEAPNGTCAEATDFPRCGYEVGRDCAASGLACVSGGGAAARCGSP